MQRLIMSINLLTPTQQQMPLQQQLLPLLYLNLLNFYLQKKEEILHYAESIVRELSSETYLAKKGDNGGFILMHSVGNIHEDNETDTAINYADYYFLEALVRWNKIND